MANVIKNKRGTTKPSASDLVVGEIAVKTDDAKLYIENDSGYVFEVGETLGTHSSSTITYTVTVATKTAAHRYNGTGSTQGYLLNGIFSPFLSLVPGNTYKFDQSHSSNSGHPFRFYLEADKTTAYTTNVTTSGTAGSSGAYTQIVVTDSTPIILHYQCSAHGYMGNSVTSNSNSISGIVNANIAANAAIAGTKISPDFGSQNIATTGTVDGKDISALGITGNTLSNGVVATTQSASDNSTKVATTAYTDTAISNLVDSSPSALNTLNELAAALGDDANFSTTVTNSIATKLPLAGGTLTGNISHGDNVVARYGAGNDLKIYHDGSNSYIDDTGTGNLNINGSTVQVLKAGGSEHMARFISDGAVELYHNNNKKLETTSSGVSVTGNISVSGTVDGRDVATDGTKLDGISTNATRDLLQDVSPQLGGNLDVNTKNIVFGDSSGSSNNRLTFGASADLEIYHDGSNSAILNSAGSGQLTIASDNALNLASRTGTEYFFRAYTNGAAELYYDNNKKLETTSSGVTVTGALTATGNITAFSDISLKKDLRPIDGALDLVGKMNGYYYKLKKDDTPSIGVIAQEIEEVFPEIVTISEFEGQSVKSVDYGKIVSVLINAINELKGQLLEIKHPDLFKN
tara:strand:- start:1300 stop:3198 length:1899 start_codon:yes stop_codon:yes gene_type:complete